jgi:glycosyltransferase involved in cell wall biosynthesis
LYLVGQLGPGGLERQLYYLLQGMDRARYRPGVVAWKLSGDDVYATRIRDLGVPLYTLPQQAPPIARLRALRRVVKERVPEVVHSYSFYTNFAAHWSCRGTPSVACGSIRCDFAFDVRNAGPILGRLSARWPHNQICNSSLVAASVRAHRGPFVPHHVAVVRNAIDLVEFKDVPPPAESERRVVAVGSLVRRKRWDRLLKAVKELQTRGHTFTVQIVGDGPLREALERQAAELNVSGGVEFLRYRADIPALLANASLLVHTSDNEGCPNVVMEAMACARPVVAMDAGDIPTLVDDGVTGFVVRRGDHAALVDRIAKLMGDPGLSRSMGRAGRAKAEQRFGVDRLIAETLAVYRNIGWRDTASASIYAQAAFSEPTKLTE